MSFIHSIGDRLFERTIVKSQKILFIKSFIRKTVRPLRYSTIYILFVNTINELIDNSSFVSIEEFKDTKG